MSLLSKKEIESLPAGIYVTRKCDQCDDPIMDSYSYASHGKDFDTRKCMLKWEEENLKKGKRIMGTDKKKKRRDEDEEEEKKKKKKKREDDDEEEDDEEDEDEADDDDDDEPKKKKSKSKDKDKKKSKSKDKDKKKSSSKSDNKKAGGYRAGSNSAIMYERLADQKRHSFKEVFKGIDSPLPTLRRLERHAKKLKKFSLNVDRDNETIRLKK